MEETIRAMAHGIATFIPGVYKYFTRPETGSFGARYCYSVWLRHIAILHKNGLSTAPRVVAELGPGDSLGIGLSAMLTGADKYWAFDIVHYAGDERNAAVMEELVELFKRRERIPDESEFPKIRPILDSYDFPGHIITDRRLDETLKPERVKLIRETLLTHKEEGGLHIRYFAPWHDPKIIVENSVDMIVSQAVLEHVEDLFGTYNFLHRWLKPGGAMSHIIDFRSHNVARQWNGHWTYPDLVWKLIRGARPYFLNRYPHSSHVEFMRKCGFEIVCDIRTIEKSRIQKKDLARRFDYLTADDLTTAIALIQAVKKN